ncbi:MAG: DUF4357 domain-containing protein [Polaromonas sp.]|nr:DUF4357 domain-containing protein [Polaromonas sp.]
MIDTPDDSDVLVVAVAQGLTRAHGKRGLHSRHIQRTPARTSCQRRRHGCTNRSVRLFAKDHLFPSPSTAAMAVMGRSTNGSLAWKTPRQKTRWNEAAARQRGRPTVAIIYIAACARIYWARGHFYPEQVDRCKLALMRPSEALSLHRTQIREIALRHRVVGVRVFGSALRGDDVAGSDLDLLVEPTPQTTLMDIGAIRFELKQLLGMDVDVLTPDGLPASFREQVLREAVAL